MMLLLDDLSSFIRNRVTTKSNDFKSVLDKKNNLIDRGLDILR